MLNLIQVSILGHKINCIANGPRWNVTFDGILDNW